MKPSSSDTFKDKWVFLSVFCPREQWHVLAGAIRRQLARLRNDGLALEKTLVFFSLHRGPAIRLALHFARVTEVDCRAIEKAIREVLPRDPHAKIKSAPPAGSFFMDFPSGEIRYNLFNERYILPGELGHVQALLSAILCTFFEDHPVDEDGVFTLLTYLDREITRHHEIPDAPSQDVSEHTDVFELLRLFGETCAAWCLHEEEPAKACTTLRQMIQLHLFKMPTEEFTTVFFNH